MKHRSYYIKMITKKTAAFDFGRLLSTALQEPGQPSNFGIDHQAAHSVVFEILEDALLRY